MTPTNWDKRVANLANKADSLFVVGVKSILPDKNIDYAIEGKTLQVNNLNLINNKSPLDRELLLFISL